MDKYNPFEVISMQVQCVLCDKVDQLEDHSFQAKTLRNHKIKLYLCRTCYDRIDKKTKERDRKSTRLNSSHVSISYAVFCLKKKTKNKHTKLIIDERKQ